MRRRLGEAHDRLARRLMRYGLEEFGEQALGVALDEFMARPDKGISDEALADRRPLFYPWFIFNWEYETEEGLLIPDSSLEKLEDRWVALERQPASLSQPVAHKTQRRSKARTERPDRGSGKKDVDGRQRKLFDDE